MRTILLSSIVWMPLLALVCGTQALADSSEVAIPPSSEAVADAATLQEQVAADLARVAAFEERTQRQIDSAAVRSVEIAAEQQVGRELDKLSIAYNQALRRRVLALRSEQQSRVAVAHLETGAANR